MLLFKLIFIVYTGLTDTGQIVAVKEMRFPLVMDSQTKKQLKLFHKEIELMKKLSHPNIVVTFLFVIFNCIKNYLGSQTTNEQVYLFLEFMPGGSVESLVAKFGALSENVTKVIIRNNFNLFVKRFIVLKSWQD